MRKKYKWIRFEEKPCGDEWLCINTGEICLGDVSYDKGWRQFIFTIHDGETWFNYKCLEDIADFLKQLNKTKGCYKNKV